MSRPIPIEEMVRLFKERHTTSHLFKIDNFSLFKKHGVERVESSVFDLAGHKWQLSVYPNENSKASGTHVSIFLVNQEEVVFEQSFELFVVSQLEPKWHSKGRSRFPTSSEPTFKGFARFITLADLERDGYLIGDCVMLGVKFHNIAPAKSGTAECCGLIEKPPNHKVTWMMTKFSSFDPNGVHYSNEFVVGTRKWRIKLYPNGFWEEKGKSLSVYLFSDEYINNVPKTETYAKFKLRVLDQGPVSRNHVEKTTWHWFGFEQFFTDFIPSDGFDDFMPLAKLKEPYLVEDKLYVGVEFEVISISSYC